MSSGTEYYSDCLGSEYSYDQVPGSCGSVAWIRIVASSVSNDFEYLQNRIVIGLVGSSSELGILMTFSQPVSQSYISLISAFYTVHLQNIQYHIDYTVFGRYLITGYLITKKSREKYSSL